MKIGDTIYSTTQAGCLDHYMYESKPLIVTAVEGVRALGDKGPLQDSVIVRTMHTDYSGNYSQRYDPESKSFIPDGLTMWFTSKEEALKYCIDKNMESVMRKQQTIMDMQTSIVKQRKELQDGKK